MATKEYKLKDLLVIKNGKDYKNLLDGSVPVYGTGGVMTYVNDKLYFGESILLPRKGSLENITYVNGDFWTVDTMYWSIVNETIAYPKYLYLYLSLLDLSKKDSGSTLPSMTFDSYYSVPVKLPSKEKQKEIANFIFQIIRKIEKNNEIIKELESMSKTLYDYWFLQFEFPNENGKPYKSSGGKMIWSEELKREIPEGWESIKLKKIVKKINRVYDYNKESKTYDLSIMPSNSISINDTSSSKDFETNLFAVKEGDILFGSIRPYLRKAGIASYDGAVAGTIHCYEVIKESDYNLALFTLTSENMFKYAINNSKGTKMPVITSDDLLEFMLPYNEEIAKKFNKIKIRDIIIANVKQSNELASLQKFLLPLLMNGQVTFKE